MRALILAVAGFVTLAAMPAEAQSRRIGPWEVTTERNRFGDGNNVIIATQARRGMVLAVRCLAGRSFSLAMIEGGFGTGRFTAGMSASAKVRIDNNAILEPPAHVVSDRVIQIDLDIDAARTMLEGREVAVRLAVGAGTADHMFPLTQSRRVLGPIFQECARPAAASPSTPAPAIADIAAPQLNFGTLTTFRDRFNARAAELNLERMTASGSCTARQSGRRATCRLELPGTVMLTIVGEDGSDTEVREIAVIAPVGGDQIARTVMAMAIAADLAGGNDRQKGALFRMLMSIRPEDSETKQLDMGGWRWWGGVAPGIGIMMGANKPASN